MMSYSDLVVKSPAAAGLATHHDLMDEQFALHAELCKILTDPKRLHLINELRDEERSVGELAAKLGMSLPNASQHLALLRRAGLVSTRREATTVFYRLSEPRIAEACDIVHAIVTDRVLPVRGARS
jgi:ArsR family transcriptional regulator